MNYCRIILILLAVLLIGANLADAQCTTQIGYICVSQAQANDTAAKLDELKAARDVIAKFMIERATNAAELAAAKQVIEGWKAIDATNTSIQQKYVAVMSMYEKVIQLQADLIEKLTAKINAPRSAWSKFLTAVKEVLLVAAGIGIARGL